MTTKPTPGGSHERARADFANRLSLMKEEAARLGLFATMQRLDVPLRMVGFEIAGDLTACTRYEAALKSVEK
jgi:hypothetical protein